MSLPMIALIGRPNVGKSTLVNRISSKKTAIVHKEPGVTRDRNYVLTDWNGVNFTLIDTGGIQFSEIGLDESISKQADFAIDEADEIIFMVDRTTGVMPDDEDIAKKLRLSKKPIKLVVNKVDDIRKHGDDVLEFYKLSLGEPIPISAEQGIGIGDLLDELINEIKEKRNNAETPVSESVKIAIVGRPNVGKSSILNKLVGTERMIVSDISGTTRDSVDSIFKFKNKEYIFIDTAGIKKISKISKSVEYYSLLRSIRSIDRADIVINVVDCAEGITDGDQKIISMALNKGCALMILLNKWDLIKNDTEKRETLHQSINKRLRYLPFVPILKASAKSGLNLKNIMPLVEDIMLEHKKRIRTKDVNNFIKELKESGRISRIGDRLKIYYGSQIATSPPIFLFSINNMRNVSKNARAWIEKEVRNKFGFLGCPVIISFKKSE